MPCHSVVSAMRVIRVTSAIRRASDDIKMSPFGRLRRGSSGRNGAEDRNTSQTACARVGLTLGSGLWLGLGLGFGLRIKLVRLRVRV